MKKILLGMAMGICLAAFLFSSYKLVSIWLGYRQSAAAYDEAAGQYTHVVEPDAVPEDTPPAESAAPAASSTEGTAEPEAEQAPITVDFDALRAENPDVVGWIYCADTPINYPVLQGEDNDLYLNTMLNGSTNAAGSIFMDYRNAADLSDCNTLIYGHNMKNNSMFGILPSFRVQSYYEEHPVMWLLMPERNWKIVLIGGAVVEDDDDIYDALYDEANVRAQVERLLQNSVFNGPALEWDHIVTLSTCAYDFEDARLVLFGVPEPAR